MYKFRNTSLKHRLVAFVVGNYAVGLHARFVYAWAKAVLFQDCDGEATPVGLFVAGVDGGMPQPGFVTGCFVDVMNETSYVTYT